MELFIRKTVGYKDSFRIKDSVYTIDIIHPSNGSI